MGRRYLPVWNVCGLVVAAKARYTRPVPLWIIATLHGSCGAFCALRMLDAMVADPDRSATEVSDPCASAKALLLWGFLVGKVSVMAG